MNFSPSEVVALRTTYVHYPRDGALLGVLIHGVAAVMRRLREWSEARRHAAEAERWLETASDRDLADIGLARRFPGHFHGVPPGRLHSVWDEM